MFETAASERFAADLQASVLEVGRKHISILYMHSAMGGGAMPQNQSRSVQ